MPRELKKKIKPDWRPGTGEHSSKERISLKKDQGNSGAGDSCGNRNRSLESKTIIWDCNPLLNRPPRCKGWHWKHKESPVCLNRAKGCVPRDVRDSKTSRSLGFEKKKAISHKKRFLKEKRASPSRRGTVLRIMKKP